MDPISSTDEFKNTVQKEAVETLLTYNRGTANIAMRLGKTLIGLTIASKFDRVLVSYPNLSILDSWLSDAEKFGINIKNITFTTNRSLHKHNMRYYDAVIIDEIHDLSENQWIEVSKQLPNKLYGLTGTPPNRGVKADFLNSLCPVRYTKKLIETTGITNKDYEIFVHLLNPSTAKNIPLKSGKLWSEAAKIDFFDKLYESKRTLTLMISLISAIKNSTTKLNYVRKLITQRKRCIVFVETIDQCNVLALPSYNSKESKSNENLQKFQDKLENKLVTVNQLRQGITFPDLSSCIILHAYASNNRASQKIGRCLNYVEGEKAIVDIVCLRGTKDEFWVKKALADFDNNKIKYVEVN